MILPCEIPQLDIPDVGGNHILKFYNCFSFQSVKSFQYKRLIHTACFRTGTFRILSRQTIRYFFHSREFIIQMCIDEKIKNLFSSICSFLIKEKGYNKLLKAYYRRLGSFRRIKLRSPSIQHTKNLKKLFQRVHYTNVYR